MATIAIDFDGVLAKYKEWNGYEHAGEPIIQGIRLVKILYTKGHTLILYTTRLNPRPFFGAVEDEAVTSGQSLGFLQEWLENQGILYCFKHFTGSKPVADLYVDDRVFLFNANLDADFIQMQIQCRLCNEE